MKNAVLLIAHAPLAQALKAAALHVIPDAAADLAALDVPAHQSPEETLAAAAAELERLGARPALVLADVVGATPCNVAQRLVERGEHLRGVGSEHRLIAGASLPMLLRALSYRGEPLETMAQRAMAGGAQGIMTVAGATAPQNQSRRAPHDQHDHHHQQ